MVESGTSAHSNRTARATQLSRAPRPQKSDAAKQSAKLASAEAKVAQIELGVELDTYFAFRAGEISRLAKKYHRSQDYIRKLLTNATQYKTTRKPMLRNAVLHDMKLKRAAAKLAAKETNASRNNDDDGADEIWEDDDESSDEELDDNSKKRIGGKIRLSKEQYATLVASMTEEEKARLIAQLESKRSTERVGVRATNRAAQADGIQVVNDVHDEMLDLFERTGIRGVAIFSRAHPDDAGLPFVIDSDEAVLFFLQVLGISKTELLARFEQWSCAQDAATRARNDINSIRKQIVRMIINGLRDEKKNRTLAMHYHNYNLLIRHELGVELSGWPKDTPFTRPSNLSTEQARDIRDRLRAGSIKWVRLTPKQKETLKQKIDAQRKAAGGRKLNARGLRSDRNKLRGPRKTKEAEKAEESEGEGSQSGSDVDGELSSSSEEEEDNEEDEDEERRVVDGPVEPVARSGVSLRVEQMMQAQITKRGSGTKTTLVRPAASKKVTAASDVSSPTAQVAPAPTGLSLSTPQAPFPTTIDTAPFPSSTSNLHLSQLHTNANFDHIPTLDENLMPLLNMDTLAADFGMGRAPYTFAGLDDTSAGYGDDYGGNSLRGLQTTYDFSGIDSRDYHSDAYAYGNADAYGGNAVGRVHSAAAFDFTSAYSTGGQYQDTHTYHSMGAGNGSHMPVLELSTPGAPPPSEMSPAARAVASPIASSGTPSPTPLTTTQGDNAHVEVTERPKKRKSVDGAEGKAPKKPRTRAKKPDEPAGENSNARPKKARKPRSDLNKIRGPREPKEA
ncbi:hypothetical protein C8R43DRAFT_1116599 [Mycena crocata]|nr:hypothetical protein C8R43DRAFT_1116599 [Mycena crocata]